MSLAKYTCACCGYRTLRRKPGNYDICHVCFWEDDPVQLLDPWYRVGANNVSLEAAQRSFLEIGVSEAQFKANVKGVLPRDVRDPTWRPVREEDRKWATTPAKLQRERPDGPWQWYYWQRNDD